MTYKYLHRFEDWIFNLDQPVTIVLLKIGGMIMGVLFVVALIVNAMDSHEYATLDLTSDFTCTESHKLWEKVRHGKTSRMEWVEHCDVYRRNP